MKSECPINFDTVKKGIIVKAQELIVKGVSPDEINQRFGEDFVKAPDTKLSSIENEAIAAIKEREYEGIMLAWTNVIKSDDSSDIEKREALKELADQLADKNSEEATSVALGAKVADTIYALVDNPQEVSNEIEPSDELVNKYLNNLLAEKPLSTEIRDIPDNQDSIFTSQPGKTQVTEAGTLTREKILTFLKNIGFTNIQTVKQLVHNGAPIEGDAYIDFLNKVMQVVEGKEDVTLPEEAMHILVELIENSDKNLFRKMEKEVIDYQLYLDVLRDPAYSKNPLYQNSDGSVNYPKIKKETIAKLLAEFLVGNTEQDIENQAKVQRVNSWWVAVKDWIRSKFGKFKNPFQKALARLEQDNLAFGEYDDIYSDQVFLAANKPQLSLEERDDKYNNTKETYERIRDKPTNLGITKIDDQYYKDGVKWEGERVSDLVDKYYKQIFKNRPLDESKREYYDKQAASGTYIHSLFEDAMNVLIDGETGLIRDVMGTRNSSLVTNKTEQAISNKIFNYMQNFLKGFPEGTRFLSETIVFDKENNRLGTIDFLAIEPSDENKEGVVSIFDWKSMLMRTLEGAADYKKKGVDIQLNAYKEILRDNYGVEKFDKIRAVPVGRVQKDDKAGGFTLVDIELGSLKLEKISERYLRPIISDSESTGNEEKDNLIMSLSGIYDKFVNLLRQNDTTNRAVLTEINDAIYELRVSSSIKNLTIYLQDLQGRMDDILALAKKETIFDIPTLTSYLSDISLYETIYGALEDASLLVEDTSISEKERIALSNVLSRIDRRMSNLEKIREEFLEKLAEQEGIYNLLKPEMVIGNISKLFRTLGNQDLATSRLMFELTKRAYNQTEIEYEKDLTELENIKFKFSEFIKSKGLSKEEAIGKLVNYKNGTLHSKISKEFYETRQKIYDSRDKKAILQFVRDNYDIEAYEEWYKKTLAEQEAFWKTQTYSADKAEDSQIKKRKKYIFAENYNITKHPLTAFGKHNPFVWSRGIKETAWLSESYKELQKSENTPLMEMYDFFVSKNRELVNAGAIREWEQYTFIPNVRKGFADVLTFDDTNWLTKIKDIGLNSYNNWKKSLMVQDYELNYEGKRDEITGEKIGKRYIPYVGYVKPEEKSYDIFTIYGLMTKQIAKENQLSKNDEILRGLLAVEANKQSFQSNKFGVISKRGDKLQLSKEKGQNLDLLKKYYKAIVEGELLQVDADNTISFGLREKWNNSVAGKLWKFDIDPETYSPTKISASKTLMWLNNLNQKRILGLNISSGLSNLFGSSFAASKIYKKYFSENDLRLAHTKMVSGAFYATEDMKKRAALVDYFLPLLDNRAHFKSTQLSVSTASTILSQEWLMAPQRKTDEIVQLNIFLAYLENTGIIDGKLVNLREMAANETGYKGRFADGDNVTTLAQQKEITKKFEDRLKELKDNYLLTNKVIFKEVERNGKKETIVEIPGIDRNSKDVEQLRTTIHTISKDATGNMDDFDIAPYRYNIYWRLFMTFKNWIPRQVDVRFGEFHKSQAHNAYEYGRFRMFYRAMGANWLASAAKLIPVPILIGASTKNLARTDYIKKAIEVYKEKKKQFQDLGLYNEKDFITQEEFIDMYMQGINSAFVEFRTMTFMMLLLTFGIMKGDDDDDDEQKNIKKLVRRQIDKMTDEISFFYSPKSLADVAGQGPPILGLFKDSYNMFSNISKQWFGVALEAAGAEEIGEEWQKKAKPMKYTFKVLPVLKEILTYIPTFDSEMAKDWGITLTNKSGQ
jgi:hypothetical protein